MPTIYLLTGSPGSGKTTAIRQAVAGINIRAGGFYTEEIRNGNIRKGFRIVTMDGQDAILAHVDITGPHRVSKYGVDINNLEKVGVSALRRAIGESDLIVVDEIGKMESFSPCFREAVLQAIDSGKKMLGTIMLNPHPFADHIKRHPSVRVIELSRSNYDQVLKEITSWIEPTTHENHH